MASLKDQTCIEEYLAFLKIFVDIYGDGASDLSQARQKICRKQTRLQKALDENLIKVGNECKAIHALGFVAYVEKSRDLFPTICNFSVDLD